MLKRFNRKKRDFYGSHNQTNGEGTGVVTGINQPRAAGKAQNVAGNDSQSSGARQKTGLCAKQYRPCLAVTAKPSDRLPPAGRDPDFLQ